MMNKIEEAIIYATVMHQGKIRKIKSIPFILHPMEVAQILSTMTDDEDVITAGLLHDIVEDTDGTLSEIESRFGARTAFLVASESEQEFPGEESGETWQRRKESSLAVLKNSHDTGVEMLWLADKLANLRSLAQSYSEIGEAIWQKLHQSDPAMQRWYYRSVAEAVELTLNKTGAFKEFIKHINFIWPGTFDSDKARYKKYREVSVAGCKLLGRGAKGDVYRYDDELVIKVFNRNNSYHDVEQETALSRRAFLLGLPTVISFGIVAVGEQYGAMYELVESETLSEHIARAPGQAETYAKIMAGLAHEIHGIEAPADFPDSTERLREYIRTGVAYEDEALAEACSRLLDTIPASNCVLHGDFHTGNVFLQNGEPLLIDLDRISRGSPVAEIADLYYFYVVLGEDDPAVIENFMGFSYQTAQQFFRYFLIAYLGTDDEETLRNVTEKASFLCCLRALHRLHKRGTLSAEEQQSAGRYTERLKTLTAQIRELSL